MVASRFLFHSHFCRYIDARFYIFESWTTHTRPLPGLRERTFHFNQTFYPFRDYRPVHRYIFSFDHLDSVSLTRVNIAFNGGADENSNHPTISAHQLRTL